MEMYLCCRIRHQLSFSSFFALQFKPAAYFNASAACVQGGPNGIAQEKQLIYTIFLVRLRKQCFFQPFDTFTVGEVVFPGRILRNHPFTSLAANRRNLPIDRQGNLTWHWQGAAAIAPATDNNSVTLRIEERTAAASKHFP